jgi:hypothetical protein
VRRDGGERRSAQPGSLVDDREPRIARCLAAENAGETAVDAQRAIEWMPARPHRAGRDDASLTSQRRSDDGRERRADAADANGMYPPSAGLDGEATCARGVALRKQRIVRVPFRYAQFDCAGQPHRIELGQQPRGAIAARDAVFDEGEPFRRRMLRDLPQGGGRLAGAVAINGDGIGGGRFEFTDPNEQIEGTCTRSRRLLRGATEASQFAAAVDHASAIAIHEHRRHRSKKRAAP